MFITTCKEKSFVRRLQEPSKTDITAKMNSSTSAFLTDILETALEKAQEKAPENFNCK